MKASNTFIEIVMIKMMIIALSVIMTNHVIGQDWYNTDWQYRRPINIENAGGSSLSEYQVKFILDGSFDFSKFNPDGSDIMFTEEDGTTLLPFWIETWEPGTTNASIWLKAPNIPLAGSTVFMYYGNLSPVITPPAPVEVPPTGPYLKDPGNPIIPIGDPGFGESLLAENIVYDDVTGHYWLLFAAYRGGQTLGLAWSDNPTDPAAWNWEGYVISDANAPHIIKSGNTWYIFYADRGHGGPPYPIGVSSSPNVNGPYTYIGSVLEPTEAWESYRVDEPYVFQRNDGKWILTYMGDPGNTEEQIGYAEADDILGPYTKFAGNPCLAFGAPGSFDAGTIADPWVYEYYGVYYIGYTVSPTIHSPWQTAMAYTSDWQTFTKNGIILPLGSEYNSFRGAVTRIGDTYVFPYTTKITSESTYQMAIATQPVFMAPPTTINNSLAVFDFIDDFNGTSLDVYKWYFARGDIAQTNIQDGLLTLTGELDYVKILGAKSFGMEYLFEAKAYHPDQGTEGLIAEVGFSDIQWNVLRIVDDFPSITQWQRQAKIVDEPDELVDMVQTADTNWHTFRIYRSNPDMAGFQIDDNPIEITTGTINTSVPTMELPPYLMSYGETNEFVIDWARVRKWSGTDPNTTSGPEQNFTDGIDIALYNTSCGKFEIRLKPDVDITDNTLSNIQFTIKWPTNSVNLIDFDSDFGIAQQGPVYIEKDTNFAVFVSTSVIPINWTAETEYTILSFLHDQSGSGYTDLLIDNGDWSSLNNGTYYVELLGFDNTGVVYQQANNIYLGFCGKLDTKVFLQGPYNTTTGLMNTVLNAAGDLPLTQPYNTSPWNYPGTENVSVMPADAIDWILVELRSAPDVASATPATQISIQAALLLYDGRIIGVDGLTLPEFNNSALDQLFIVLWHRNHLGIISAYAGVQSAADFYDYDFTSDISQTYGDGQNHLGGGVYGMIGGDANADGTINLSDAIQIWIPQAGTAGYLNGDTNLDRQVNNPDKNDIWFENMNKETYVPD